jgi:hypothetical protein
MNSISYQLRSSLVKDEIGNLLADSHSIWNRQKNYFCQLIGRVIKLTVAIIEKYHCYQLHTKLYPVFFCRV